MIVLRQTEYEKKLADAKSLVINVKSDKKSPVLGTMDKTRCRINLDDQNDAFLTVTVYNGDLNVHIRRFNERRGELVPTKRRVSHSTWGFG